MFLKFRNRNNDPDEVLIHQYQKDGDEKLIGILFQRYTHLVYGVCMKYLKDEELSKDHTMQIFESLLFKLKEHDVQNFAPWLHMVTRNHCLMYLRKEKSTAEKQEKMHYLQQDSVEINDFFHQDSKEKHDGNLIALEEALKELKEDQKQCVELFYLKQKSYQEISDETGFSLNQVKSYIQNGKRNLKILMEKRDGQ